MSANENAYQRTPKEYDRTITIKNGICVENNDHVHFASNHVISSSYTWYNFPFKNFFEQFQNTSNIYFFGIGLMQMIKPISVTKGVPGIWPVLAVLMIISATRAAYEDWQKHKSDNVRNSKKYLILNSDGVWKEVASGDIKVGHIIQVLQDQMVPADLLLLGSSNEKNQCFLDRANINGETRLEVMNAIPLTSPHCRGITRDKAGTLLKLSAVLEYKKPTKKFEEFDGELKITEKIEKINEEVLIMREANVRNCKYAIGLVVYTGTDTKIEMSHSDGEKEKLKMSHIFRQVDRYQLYLILIQVACCICGGVLDGMYSKSNNHLWYINSIVAEKDIPMRAFRTTLYGFFGWFQVLSQLVPVSLIVTSEMVKFIAAKFVQWDRKFYSETLQKGAKVNRTTVPEDTGSVDIIFSDKTGTLTRNKMEFRYLRLAGFPKKKKEEGRYGPGTYGSTKTQISEANRRRSMNVSISINKWSETVPARSGGIDAFPKREKTRIKEKIGQNDVEAKSLDRFLEHMALSNTVKPYYENNQLKFQSNSAEEDAMVKFAMSLDYRKENQNPTILRVGEKKEERKFNHLATLGFTSARSRVTVIYQHIKKGENDIHVMTKGQDVVILPLLKDLSDEEKVAIEHEIFDLSVRGMRSLVCAYAEHSVQWWDKWGNKYDDAIASHNSDEQYKIFEQIEEGANLKYLGIMALEDQLQPLAPEVIADCFKANIKVWMLTGDKLEAAKSIGTACNLIAPIRLKDDGSLPKENESLVEIALKWYLWTRDKEEQDNFFQLVAKREETDQIVKSQSILYFLEEMHAPECIKKLFQNEEEIDQGTFKNKISDVRKKLTRIHNLELDIDRAERMARVQKEKISKISMLVSRKAFTVLYPELTAENDSDNENKQIKDLRERFFELAVKSQSVVFARALPAMKKKIVSEIKKRYPDFITLAIGDGANDAEMIRIAHVGVGISGVEGTAAVNASDYALPQFSMLHTLLFVHGFWSYRRISYLVNFLCYKALLFVFPMLWYGVVSRFAPFRRWDFVSQTFYNVLYTAFPVMVISLWDQILPRNILQDYPNLYNSQQRKLFNPTQFLLWLLRATVHGSTIWTITYYTLGDHITGENGDTHGITYFSLTLYLSIVITVIIIGFFDMNSFWKLNIFAICCSLFSLMGVTPFVSFLFPTYETYGVIGKMWNDPQFWLVIILSVTILCLIEFTIRSYMYLICPDLVIKARIQFYTKGHCKNVSPGKKKKKKSEEEGPGKDRDTFIIRALYRSLRFIPRHDNKLYSKDKSTLLEHADEYSRN